jgi:TolA-binding protein
MDPKTLVTWLALASAIATGAARIQSLEEAKTNAVRGLTAANSEIEQLRARIEHLESDSNMLEKLHQLDLRITSIEARTQNRRNRR